MKEKKLPDNYMGGVIEYEEKGDDLALGMKMVYVFGGTFMMGATGEQGDDAEDDEKPPHVVTLPPYYIGKCAVTQKQYETVMGKNPSCFKGDNLPVENITWNEVQEFCRKLSLKTKKLGRKYILPTEAQWEFAARGSNNSRCYKYSGNTIMIDDVAWYKLNSENKTHDVDTKKTNELSIYNMSGNVWEWCSDWYNKDYYSKSPRNNPQGQESGTDRVIRGGSWGSDEKDCRVSRRRGYKPDEKCCTIGFRVICVKEME